MKGSEERKGTPKIYSKWRNDVHVVLCAQIISQLKTKLSSLLVGSDVEIEEAIEQLYHFSFGSENLGYPKRMVNHQVHGYLVVRQPILYELCLNHPFGEEYRIVCQNTGIVVQTWRPFAANSHPVAQFQHRCVVKMTWNDMIFRWPQRLWRPNDDVFVFPHASKAKEDLGQNIDTLFLDAGSQEWRRVSIQTYSN